jgi:hypothetical protein
VGLLAGKTRRALDSTVLNDAVATQGHDHPSSQSACFGKQTATRPREFGIHESDGAPDEKESRPKHEHLVTRRA